MFSSLLADCHGNPSTVTELKEAIGSEVKKDVIDSWKERAQKSIKSGEQSLKKVAFKN